MSGIVIELSRRPTAVVGRSPSGTFRMRLRRRPIAGVVLVLAACSALLTVALADKPALSGASDDRNDWPLSWNRRRDWKELGADWQGRRRPDPKRDEATVWAWFHEYLPDADSDRMEALDWNAARKCAWDSEWHSCGHSSWDVRDNVGPCISKDDLCHIYGGSGPGHISAVPVVRWFNPCEGPLELVIRSGPDFALCWSGVRRRTNKAPVDIVVALVDRSDSNRVVPVYFETIQPPASPVGGAKVALPLLRLPPLRIDPGDQLIIAVRAGTPARSAVAWTHLYDDLTLRARVYRKPAAPKPGRALEADKLTDAWAALDGDDEPKARAAMDALAGSPEELPALVRKRVVSGPTQEDIARLIVELDSPKWTARERATAELVKIGRPARKQLERAQADKSQSAEVHARAEWILKQIGQAGPPRASLAAQRAVLVLRRIATPDAIRLLKAIRDGAESPLLRYRAAMALSELSTDS